MHKGRRVPVGSLSSVIQEFRLHDKFLTLAKNTRKGYDRGYREAERIMGAIPVEELTPFVMQKFLDKFSDVPDMQRIVLHSFKSLEKWGLKRGKFPHPFTLGCEAPGGGGHHTPWTDEQVKCGEENARADISRAITLAANTGQRVSDIATMAWDHIEPISGRPGIWVTQKKTKRELWVPFTKPLILAMEGWPRFPRWMVSKPSGEPYSAERLSDTFFDHVHRQPALAPLRAAGVVFHGLRATAVVRLRRAGVSQL
jgi:hypothetical protein